jgi:hypothetical protein
MLELLDPGVLGVCIPIIAIILGYRLISRNIELKRRPGCVANTTGR